ncbi:MAG TPA: Rieske (2Fe-2S) protein [Myxococcota bacterium]|jgi:nitrite reductase/ring-hydroxylating ferredoxin subunit|nr:Rieske (2Fe-2S) protein [Myxococcota bacterium]
MRLLLAGVSRYTKAVTHRHVSLGTAAAWAPGTARVLPTARGGIAVFRDSEGTFLAVSDLCPHRGASLAAGFVEDGLVVCADHDWAFDARTGLCHRGGEGARLRVYAVSVHDGEVLVSLPPDERVEGPPHDPVHPLACAPPRNADADPDADADAHADADPDADADAHADADPDVDAHAHADANADAHADPDPDPDTDTDTDTDRDVGP